MMLASTGELLVCVIDLPASLVLHVNSLRLLTDSAVCRPAFVISSEPRRWHSLPWRWHSLPWRRVSTIHWPPQRRYSIWQWPLAPVRQTTLAWSAPRRQRCGREPVCR